MKRIAVLASGNGSNAENIIRYFNDCRKGAYVPLVITNKEDAGVIARAEALNVDVRVMSRKEINNPANMLGLLDEYRIDIVVLAGFLLMVPSFLIERYRGMIINIHPSLLPKYGGKGMYGRHVHEAVVASGERVTGITIHHVSEECDGGRIIFQASVSVAEGDTPADVETKIHLLEKEHYPRVIREELVDKI